MQNSFHFFNQCFYKSRIRFLIFCGNRLCFPGPQIPFIIFFKDQVGIGYPAEKLIGISANPQGAVNRLGNPFVQKIDGKGF